MKVIKNRLDSEFNKIKRWWSTVESETTPDWNEIVKGG